MPLCLALKMGGGALEDQKFRVILSYIVKLRPTWATKPTEMLWLQYVRLYCAEGALTPPALWAKKTAQGIRAA